MKMFSRSRFNSLEVFLKITFLLHFFTMLLCVLRGFKNLSQVGLMKTWWTSDPTTERQSPEQAKCSSRAKATASYLRSRCVRAAASSKAPQQCRVPLSSGKQFISMAMVNSGCWSCLSHINTG